MQMDFSHILTDPYTLVLTCLMGASFIVLCLYYGIFYFRVGHYKGAKPPKKDAIPAGSTPPVSVVLTSQNDGEWLRSNLVYLLEQDYPNFEVVVVDYMSRDDTQFVLQLLADNYPNLKVVTIRENANGYLGKKYPMSMGITSAKNDILLLADPDCMPLDLTNFSWIKEMVAGYCSKHTQMVLGYCGIESKKGLFNLLQQYDNLDYSVEYLAAAIMHRPFTANGRNLSYRRSMFMKNRGFIYHYNIPDGTDDMFVNQNATGKNTNVVITPNAFTMVQPQKTLSDWHSYRKHRSYTHRYYSFGLKTSRLMRNLNVTLFYLLGIALLLMGTMPWEVLAAALLVKLVWGIVATAQSTARLGIKPAVYWLQPLLEIYFLVANTILAISPLPKK